MKSGAISIDRYAGGEPAEQFDFLYENFSILSPFNSVSTFALIILETEVQYDVRSNKIYRFIR